MVTKQVVDTVMQCSQEEKQQTWCNSCTIMRVDGFLVVIISEVAAGR